jgi:hypothetical protein
MTDDVVKRRNQKLAPPCMALARHDQWLSRAEYEECCAFAGIEPRPDEEIRRDESLIRDRPYTCSEDPTAALEIRRRIDCARLSAISQAA